jgi:methylated-DNA-[protein]-cysteine S-methyltransferase
MFDVTVDFPKMKVAVATRDGRVVGIHYLPLNALTIIAKNSLAERAARQLERYREDPDAAFDLPLAVEGTPFQKSVWQAMCAIPRGRTRTYGDLAREIGGFAHATEGYLIEAKRWLLAHEIRPEEFALRP